MEMAGERKGILEEGGINVKEAMQRFMNNEQLWIKFLKKFKADSSYEKLVKSIEEKEWNKERNSMISQFVISAQRLMAKQGLTAEQACDLLGYDGELRAIVLPYLVS